MILRMVFAIGMNHFKRGNIHLAKLIKITKIYEKNSIHYYDISTKDFQSKEFYIGIDSPNKQILVFDAKDFSKPLNIININQADEIIDIPSIDPRLLWPVIGQAIKALQQNLFPQYLDYHA